MVLHSYLYLRSSTAIGCAWRICFSKDGRLPESSVMGSTGSSLGSSSRSPSRSSLESSSLSPSGMNEIYPKARERDPMGGLVEGVRMS
ncbi:hypothetical protein RJT34_07521 [Clitoria ternatea]|uniref:Uncharacterized protein n=1 Tax=Clitoria ternatea TaxID=43366 RepID=A0AAN9K5E7_CLITE